MMVSHNTRMDLHHQPIIQAHLCHFSQDLSAELIRLLSRELPLQRTLEELRTSYDRGQAELLNKVDTAPISALGTSPDTKAASLRATANQQMFEAVVPPRETNTIGTEQQIQDSEQEIMGSQDFINQFI